MELYLIVCFRVQLLYRLISDHRFRVAASLHVAIMANPGTQSPIVVPTATIAQRHPGADALDVLHRCVRRSMIRRLRLRVSLHCLNGRRRSKTFCWSLTATCASQLFIRLETSLLLRPSTPFGRFIARCPNAFAMQCLMRVENTRRHDSCGIRTHALTDLRLEPAP